MQLSRDLQTLFSQAHILGGSPCSGKSNIAEMFSTHYDFHYYRADDHDPEHMRRATPEQQPVMFKFTKMSWDEIWSPAPEEQYALELAYFHERFPFILKDLSQLNLEV